MDDITYQVSSDKPAIMLSSGNFHRYWKATVNGNPAKVYKAFGTLRAVVVPAGNSTVHFEYKSDAVRYSLWMGAVAFAIFIAVMIIANFCARKARRN